MRLFLTGEPGVGKTTIIREAIQGISSSFWVISEEIRDANGARQGFRAKNSNGQEAIFAHKTDIVSSDQVGSFKVDVGEVDTVFSRAIERALNEDKKVFIIDEIGRMEVLSPVFVAAIDQVLSRPVHLIATIRQGDDWTRTYTNHPGAILLHVTNHNRDHIKAVLRDIIKVLDIYGLLSVQQQIKVTSLASKYATEDQFTQLHKLFNNALTYVAENRVLQTDEGLFMVSGNNKSHKVEHNGSIWQCDCDLYRGRGKYVGTPGECSHVQAVKIVTA